jgi:hypothetical protein
MSKREDVSGWNARYSKNRFRGQNGSQGSNVFPLEGQYVSKTILFSDGTGNHDTASTIPADATIEGVGLVLTDVFDAGTTITCGKTTAATYLCDGTVFDIVTAPGSFYETVEKAWTATATVARAVLINGGGVTIGSLVITYYYTV